MPGQFQVTAIDLTILVAYIILSRVLAIWLVRGQANDADGFFLGGRNFIWPMIGFSLFATNMSGASFVGLAGAGYNSGISVYSYEWMAAVILVFFILFVLPFYLNSKVFTMPEFLERRYDRRSRYLFAIMLLILGVFLDCAGALYAGGLVVNTLFPDLPLWVGVLGLALLAAVLSVTGGLGAVVVSDTIQAVVLIIGGTIIFFAAWAAIPSWDAVREAAPAGAMHIVQPMSDPALPWPGLITGVLIIGSYFWMTNQLIVQRCLGAKNLDHGRWGALFAGFLKLPILFIMVLPGTMAVALYPDLPSPDQAFPMLAFDLLPIGVRGVILAALVAAITSSVDSILNSSSTLMTMDLVRPLRPGISDRSLVLIGRITTAAVTLVAVLWAPQIVNFPSLWQYLQSILSYMVPPVLAVFLMAIFWKHTSATAAFVTLCVGVGAGIIGFAMNEVFNVFSIQFLYASGISFVLSIFMLIVVSLFTEGPSKEVQDTLTWSPALWHEETEALKGKPAWQNYRYQSIALLGLTALIVGIYW
ncbi:sodium:solute symporter [Paracoccaceae bacterium GXU_MW_L88]